MKKNYHDLSQGDLVYIDLNPTKGHEQRGKRPCIILSKSNKYLNYMIGVAPITTKAKPFPVHVDLNGTQKIKGQILLEHHRMIDIESRGFQFVEAVPKEILEECIEKIKLFY
ncbi:type II toxin-antitoxin system PemK/MazF family toxin [Enterococcus faecium]|nr:type II toxin-antitoxin system PemK/MazF family toxin [Enterococcus faecium]